MRKLRQERVRDLPTCTASKMVGLGFEPGRMGLLPPIRIKCCFGDRRAVNVGGPGYLLQFQGQTAEPNRGKGGT